MKPMAMWLIVASMLAVQVPLPVTEENLPLLPSPEKKAGPVAPEPAPLSKPAAFTPVNGGLALPKAAPPPASVGQEPPRQDSGKPPALQLVDSLPHDATAVKPPTAATVAGTVSVLPGSVVTPCLVLSRQGPASVKAGQPFTYDIIVRNAGSSPAGDVHLEDRLPPGTKFVFAQPLAFYHADGDRLAWTLPVLAPRTELRIRVEVEAVQGGQWNAQAVLTVPLSCSWTTKVSGTATKLLDVTGPATVPVGHAVRFPIRVTNTTATAFTDAVLRVQLSSGLQHLQGDAIEGSLGDLAPGQSKNLTFDAIAAQTGRLAIDVTLVSGPRTLAAVQASATAGEQPIVSIRQTAPPIPAAESETEIKLEVVNKSAEAQDIVLTDPLPEALQYIAGDGAATYDPVTRTLRWNLGNLAPGQARTLTFRAMVRGAAPMIHRVTARTGAGHEAQLLTIVRPR